MEKEDVILSFKGQITQDLLTSVYQIMESRLDSKQEETRRKKKFYHILIECLQNVYHHMEKLQGEQSPEMQSDFGNAIFMVGQNEDLAYSICTGNYILNTNVAGLEERLREISLMTPDALRAHYLEKLNSTDLSDKGGAGLGMIDIARKSGHPLTYSFHPVNATFSFFCLEVLIK
ncbi:MAG: hypothetical protein IPO27_04515 [Bacteroidetes bacterium]|nr:hypothetical protein [Bacteroidota bacterium]